MNDLEIKLDDGILTAMANDPDSTYEGRWVQALALEVIRLKAVCGETPDSL